MSSCNNSLDLIIVEATQIHELVNLPKHCDVCELLALPILDGSYFFDVDYRTKKLSLHNTTGNAFGLMVPNDELRFCLGLDKTLDVGYFSKNGSIRFHNPTIMYKVQASDFNNV